MSERSKRLALCLAAMLPLCVWAGDNDFGLWGEMSVTKRLPYNLSVGLEAEARGKDNLQNFDRWNVGVNLGYKPLKWLRLSVGYTFLQSYKAESIKDKYKGEDSHPERIGDPAYWKGYNLTESYSTPKHRIVAMATFTSPKLWKCIRVSLRERYQFTWRNEQEVGRTKYRYYQTTDEDCDMVRGEYRYKLDGEPEQDTDVKLARQTHSLRSRLRVTLDKKRIHWHPFASFETYNDLKDGLRMTDWRLSAGTSWDVSNNHSVGAAYIYNVERDVEGNGHQHVLSLSYEYKF